MYEPNDSPFGDAFRAYVAAPQAALEQDDATLEEFLSVAAMLRTVPVHADDERLVAFYATLDETLWERRHSRKPAPALPFGQDVAGAEDGVGGVFSDADPGL